MMRRHSSMFGSLLASGTGMMLMWSALYGGSSMTFVVSPSVRGKYNSAAESDSTGFSQSSPEARYRRPPLDDASFAMQPAALDDASSAMRLWVGAILGLVLAACVSAPAASAGDYTAMGMFDYNAEPPPDHGQMPDFIADKLKAKKARAAEWIKQGRMFKEVASDGNEDEEENQYDAFSEYEWSPAARKAAEEREAKRNAPKPEARPAGAKKKPVFDASGRYDWNK